MVSVVGVVWWVVVVARQNDRTTDKRQTPTHRAEGGEKSEAHRRPERGAQEGERRDQKRGGEENDVASEDDAGEGQEGHAEAVAGGRGEQRRQSQVDEEGGKDVGQRTRTIEQQMKLRAGHLEGGVGEEREGEREGERQGKRRGEAARRESRGAQ